MPATAKTRDEKVRRLQRKLWVCAKPEGDEETPGTGARVASARQSGKDVKQIIAELNPVLRGWRNYFRMGNADREFNRMDSLVWQCLRLNDDLLGVACDGLKGDIRNACVSQYRAKLLPMGSVNPSVMFAVFVVAILLFVGKNWRDVYARLYEGIENFRNFRGGPGSPSHPIPANDSFLLNRRRKLADSLGNRRKR